MTQHIPHKPLKWPASVDQIWAYAKSWPTDIYKLWISCIVKEDTFDSSNRLRKKHPQFWNQAGEFDPFFNHRNAFVNMVHKIRNSFFNHKIQQTHGKAGKYYAGR